MTSKNRRAILLAVLGFAAAVSGCGTVKEKTAPCKRPANLLAYGADPVSGNPVSDCGPMRPVNGVPNAADEAFQVLKAG